MPDLRLGEPADQVLADPQSGEDPDQEHGRELELAPSSLKSRVQRARKRLLAQLERCCRLELDRRGLPVDWECRNDGCGCSDGAGDAPS